jgi:hypothetical protein
MIPSRLSRRLAAWALGALLAVSGHAARAQQPAATSEAPSKTLFEEVVWFAYVENSVTLNLRGDTV